MTVRLIVNDRMMIMAIVRRQNDVRGSFYKLFTPQGLFSNNCRRGSVFLGFRQQEWRNPYFAITAGGIPQRITPTRGAKYMHVGYAKSTSEKYPCMHHSPMHPTPCLPRHSMGYANMGGGIPMLVITLVPLAG